MISKIGWPQAFAIVGAAKISRRADLAKRLPASQSRIAKVEAGDPSVSSDLLIRSLLILGASRRERITSARPPKPHNVRAERRAPRVRPRLLFRGISVPPPSWQQFERLGKTRTDTDSGEVAAIRGQHSVDVPSLSYSHDWKIAVHRNEDLELAFRSGEKLAVLERSPARFRHRPHVVSQDVPREARRSTHSSRSTLTTP